MPATDTYCTAHSIDDFRHNLATVQRRIAEACKRAGRDPQTVRLLPVSKTIPEDRLRLAYAAGCRQMGENKVQEALRKAETMSDLSDLRWSVIGHLQTNKAKYVARFASEFQALDNLRVAQELDRRLQAEGRGLDVLVHVRQLPAFTSLRVHGLMTLAVFSPDLALVRPCFVKLRHLRDQLRQEAPDGIDMTDLSMGMSGDFEAAIEEGATIVRVGQAIFGPRTLPDSHYWPPSNPTTSPS